MATGSGGESGDPSWGFESRWIHTCLHGSRRRLLAVTAVGEAAATRTIVAAVVEGGGREAPELIRRVEVLEAAVARLRGEKEAAEEAVRGLQAELEAERASAEMAASEAMLMIEWLQREKAAAQMEAR